MIEELAAEKRKQNILTLAAAMLTGNNAPGDALIDQVLLIANAIVEKIENAA